MRSYKESFNLSTEKVSSRKKDAIKHKQKSLGIKITRITEILCTQLLLRFKLSSLKKKGKNPNTKNKTRKKYLRMPLCDFKNRLRKISLSGI